MNKLVPKITEIPKGPYERIIRLFLIGQTVIVIYMVIVVINRGINEGRTSGTTTGLISSVSTSIVVAILIAVFFWATNIGFRWWESLSEWLENKFKLLPAFRRSIIAVGAASSPLVLYWAVSKMQSDLSLRVLVVIYYGLVLPAAIISLTREDRAKEDSPLTKYISREAFAQDPQAALAKAFIVVEDCLAKKVRSSERFSRGLINEAYRGEQSKLVLLIDGTDRTADFRDFLSGAYGILRNPRHHALVEDDLYTSASIFAVAELLLEYVNASQQREEITKQ